MWDLFVMESGGGPWTNLTQSPDEEEYQPAWSPGRARDRLSEKHVGPGRARSLRPRHRDGVTRRMTEPSFLPQWPAWSPDGEQIVFSGVPRVDLERQRAVHNIHVINRDGTGFRQLTHFDLTPAVYPAWFDRDVLAVSPNGKAATTWGSVKQGPKE